MLFGCEVLIIIVFKMLDGIMSTKTIGDEYEDFTSEILERIVEIQKIGLIKINKIDRNVKLPAEYDANREIDILLTCPTSDGKEIKMAIECKGYKSPVSIEKIDAFYTKCNDLKVDKAIFFSKHGYQSAAIKAAEYHAIQLYELRKPEEADWAGRIRNIILSMTCIYPENIRVGLIMDLSNNTHLPALPSEGISGNTVVQFSDGMNATFFQLACEDAKGKSEGLQKCECERRSGQIEIGEAIYKFAGFNMDYYLRFMKQEITIKGDEIVMAIMDAFGIGKFLVTRDGDVRSQDVI